ncbi:RHS repeat protein, partial [Salmonella enterica subsp. enterica serovar Weltevreden]|nr:RHS repeat protein [Salmonella enterica subsp. enterica]EGM6634354.1 RHS repeat protein [Salmonella enterica subsp. enterica serovar Weltevreden]
PQGPWWVLGWPERVPGADEALPAPLPPYRVLTGLADSYGRTLTYHRAAEGEVSGNVTGVTDGAGTETYEQSSVYNLTGQLQSQHLNHPQLNREYGYDEGGRLVRISGPQQTREYRYSESGRLTGVHTSAANLDITLPYATDPAGNRLPDPEFYPDSASTNTITSTGWSTMCAHSTTPSWRRGGISTTRWAAGWANGYGSGSWFTGATHGWNCRAGHM